MQNLSFYDWLLFLRVDIAKNKALALANHIPENFLSEIYQDGVEPTLEAVLDWSLEDPELVADQRYWHELRSMKKPAQSERGQAA